MYDDTFFGSLNYNFISTDLISKSLNQVLLSIHTIRKYVDILIFKKKMNFFEELNPCTKENVDLLVKTFMRLEYRISYIE